jgi:site-specific DNA recombinase
MKPNPLACAIYTRKSSEEGLEQDFNSLDAQREACAAYILSQKALGWNAMRDTYDDGGFSGGSTDRPGLQRLLADIALGKVKVVVVYKVDRLTRSLADFAKMVELFDAHGVSFVSVTQQFNTTTSMGRLTLNVLLSFAQFEREVTGERIRDKIAASKRKGMWMGGMCPVGYLPRERTLSIDEEQALKVRLIYTLYLELGCVRLLGAELQNRGIQTPPRMTRRSGAAGNRPFSRGHLYRILRNPIYIGQIAHKDQVFPGNHPPIIDLELWQKVQDLLESNRQGQKTQISLQNQHLLAGLISDREGHRFTGSYSQKGTRRYRYYVQQLQEGQPIRIPAQELENLILQSLKNHLADETGLLQEMPEQAKPATGLMNARTFRDVLDADPAGALPQLLKGVIVTAESVTLQLDMRVIWEGETNQPQMTLTIPATLQRSGMAMKLVLNAPNASSGKPDPKLIRLVERAHQLAMQFISGKVQTVQEIAKTQGVTPSYITRLLPIGFLAPDILQAIAQGKQPMSLTVQKLLRTGALPLAWTDQARLLGFEKDPSS